MRIGKLTLDEHYNYGNKLQNYALQVFLEKYAEQVDTIWHFPQDQFFIDMNKWGLSRRVRYALSEKKSEKRINRWMHDAIRQYRFKQFDDRYIHTRYDCSDLGGAVSAEYDFFVVGSDQVWGPNIGHHQEARFLTFAPKKKRISYAASFGVSEIPKEKQKAFAEWLRDMAFISVREQRGAEIVKELTGREVPVVVDPTMLLSKKEWEKIEQKPIWISDETEHNGYILLYFLSPMAGAARQTVHQLAKEKGLGVIELMDETQLDAYCADPAEFLWLISHAALVYTDSFHGTVFSILNERPFVVCDRRTKQNMNSRLETLLGLFHFENRFGTDSNGYAVEDPFDMDFSGTEGILAEEREKSDRFMRKALGISEKEE